MNKCKDNRGISSVIIVLIILGVIVVAGAAIGFVLFRENETVTSSEVAEETNINNQKNEKDNKDKKEDNKTKTNTIANNTIANNTTVSNTTTNNESNNKSKVNNNNKEENTDTNVVETVYDNENTEESNTEEQGIPTLKGDTKAQLSTTGWTNGSIQVTLPTTEGFETRYEIDGTATTESTEYLNPFEVNKNCTIRYVYSIGSEIGEEGIIVISNFDELAPKEFTPTITCTSSTIKIISATEDQESETSGKSDGIIYRFSKDNGTTYTEWQESGNYTFTGLTNNQEYKVVVQAKDAAGNITTTTAITKELEGIPTLSEEGETVPQATVSTTGWTNGPITVTLPTIDGFETRYEINGTPSASSTQYTEPFEVSKNCTIKYVYSDGTNIGGAGSLVIANYDELAPKTFTPTATTTTNSITVTSETEDQESETSGKSGGITYRFSIDNGTTYTEWQESGNYTFTDLTNNQEYRVIVQAKDAVGNTTTTTVTIVQLGQVASLTEDATAVINPTGWTNQTITVTLPTENGFETRYEINGTPSVSSTQYTEPFTIEENCVIKYVYSDGINIGGAGTLNINNYDNLEPNGFTPTATVTTNSITVVSSTTDQDATATSGKSDGVKYRFSKDNGTTYTEWQTSGTYIFTGLENNQTYTIKVQARDAAANITIGTEIIKQLDEITSLADDTLATVSTIEWTNQAITVTLPTMTGFETRYEINGTPTTSSTQYTEPFTVEENCVIKYAYSDGTNIGGAGTLNIENYDNTKPQITEVAANNSNIRITLSGTDAIGKINGYFYNTTGVEPTKDMNGWNGIAETNSLNIEIAELNSETTYYFWLKDIAGNISDRKSATTIVGVSSITLNAQKTILVGGNCSETSSITTNVQPSNAANKTLRWSSSNEEVATVDENGVVNPGSKVGTVTITATATDDSNVSQDIIMYVPYVKEYFIKDGEIKNSSRYGTLQTGFEGTEIYGRVNYHEEYYTNWPKDGNKYSYPLDALLKNKTAFEAAREQNVWTIQKVNNSLKIHSELYGASNSLALILEKTDGESTAGNIYLDYEMEEGSYALSFAFGLYQCLQRQAASEYKNAALETGAYLGNETNVWKRENIINNTLATSNGQYISSFTISNNSIPAIAVCAGGTTYSGVYIRNYYFTYGNFDATTNQTEWTNQPITITLPKYSGLDTVYTIDGSEPTINSTKYSQPFTLSQRCTIKYAYSNGTSIGEIWSLVTKYDGVSPEVENITVDAASEALVIRVRARDELSGLDKVKIYYKSDTMSDYSCQVYQCNSKEKGSTDIKNITSVVENLNKETTYNVYAEIYDVAGNKTRTPATGTVTVTTRRN